MTGGSALPAARSENGETPLPASDAALQAETLTLGLTGSASFSNSKLDGVVVMLPLVAAPIGAEAMRGADRRAQALGVSGGELMRNAGAAVAGVAHAMLMEGGRWGSGPILVLAGLNMSPTITGCPFASVPLVRYTPPSASSSAR